MKNSILLNWFPPSIIEMPSPAMSVLKSHLVSEGFNVRIKYWNIALISLQKEFIWWGKKPFNQNEFHSLLLFYNYLSFKYNDKNVYYKVKSVLLSLKPQYLNIGSTFFDDHMEEYAQKLENTLNNMIEELDFQDILYVGMSMNLYQWICASIIGDKIKSKYPHIPIVIGGIGTKEAAISFLKNFPQFDIATWGEGEFILSEITQCIREGISWDNVKEINIPNMAYRNKDDILISDKVNHNFVDLSVCSVRPNLEDYFFQINPNLSPTSISLFIEGGRGCHWKKCNFCYLNTGYKYRVKPVENILEEIKYGIEKYNVNYFQFLDNDIIANDLERFDKLLKGLISIKNEHPNFDIILAEIITQGINARIIRNMALAGFTHVQIGYESSSNELLRKINKKNTFASNLLFIKFASKYNIHVEGANIIKGLLEENDEYVLESIENLRMLRFFFRNGFFSHSMSNLGINRSSKYFSKIKDFSNFRSNVMESYLPSSLLLEEEKQNMNFTEKIFFNEKLAWSSFDIVENYYLKLLIEYELLGKEESFIYKEYLNRGIINELEIDYSSIEWCVLKHSNDEIFSIDKLKKMHPEITDCEIINILEDLRKEGLIYTNNDYTEILSIIDIESIK